MVVLLSQEILREFHGQQFVYLKIKKKKKNTNNAIGGFKIKKNN